MDSIRNEQTLTVFIAHQVLGNPGPHRWVTDSSIENSILKGATTLFIFDMTTDLLIFGLLQNLANVVIEIAEVSEFLSQDFTGFDHAFLRNDHHSRPGRTR